MSTEPIRNVVLVHGAFVDGSGWRAVHDLLLSEGYTVSIVQNPTESLAGDVIATRNVLDQLEGPAVLVGHSYGGVVISEAGNHDKVAALVYVAAFAPDKGESVGSLIADPPPEAPAAPIVGPVNGFLTLDKEQFPQAFAADIPIEEARFLANSQVPWGLEALGGTVTEPAWRNRPTFYLLAGEDRTIPPTAQKFMAERANATVTEVASSHAAYISHPESVVSLIQAAAGA